MLRNTSLEDMKKKIEPIRFKDGEVVYRNGVRYAMDRLITPSIVEITNKLNELIEAHNQLIEVIDVLNKEGK